MAKQAPVMLERHTHVSVVHQCQIYYLPFQNQRGHGVFNIDKLRLIRGAAFAYVIGLPCEPHHYQIDNKFQSLSKVVSSLYFINLIY